MKATAICWKCSQPTRVWCATHRVMLCGNACCFMWHRWLHSLTREKQRCTLEPRELTRRERRNAWREVLWAREIDAQALWVGALVVAAVAAGMLWVRL